MSRRYGLAKNASREAEGGANAAFFLDLEELRGTRPGIAAPNAPMLPEVSIEGWVPPDDAVPDEVAASFTDETRFHGLPEEWQFPHAFHFTLQTKLGGVPYWTGQGPMRVPQPPFRFLLQVDKFLAVPGAGEDGLDLANFCSDGTGFVFVDAGRADLPTSFFINR